MGNAADHTGWNAADDGVGFDVTSDDRAGRHDRHLSNYARPEYRRVAGKPSPTPDDDVAAFPWNCGDALLERCVDLMRARQQADVLSEERVILDGDSPGLHVEQRIIDGSGWGDRYPGWVTENDFLEEQVIADAGVDQAPQRGVVQPLYRSESPESTTFQG